MQRLEGNASPVLLRKQSCQKETMQILLCESGTVTLEICDVDGNVLEVLGFESLFAVWNTCKVWPPSTTRTWTEFAAAAVILAAASGGRHSISNMLDSTAEIRSPPSKTWRTLRSGRSAANRGRL